MAAFGFTVFFLAVSLELGLGEKVKVSWKECNLEAEKRLNCAYNGITEEKCYQRGCCWAENPERGIACYHSITTAIPQCSIENDDKEVCGPPGVKKHHCLARDCCWQPSNDLNAPWCYSKKTIPVLPESCGVPAITPSTRNSKIVGGVDAKPHSWPWQVSLQLGGSHFCGASIINENWVLSAAHCGAAWHWGEVTVVVGLHDKDNPEDTIQRVYASNTYENEAYDYDEGTNNLSDDIMLIQLDEPIQFNDHVSAVCLPDQDEESFRANMRCYVTGWGTTELHGSTPSKLQQVSIPIVDQEKCVEFYEDPKNWYDNSGNAPNVTEKMICGGFLEGGRGSCHGDSGGPFVCVINDEWKLAGVVSWGGPCAHEQTPSVFARVSEYHDWIIRTIQENQQK